MTFSHDDSTINIFLSIIIIIIIIAKQKLDQTWPTEASRASLPEGDLLLRSVANSERVASGVLYIG